VEDARVDLLTPELDFRVVEAVDVRVERDPAGLPGMVALSVGVCCRPVVMAE